MTIVSRLQSLAAALEWERVREQGRNRARDRWCLRPWLAAGDITGDQWDAAVWYEGRIEAQASPASGRPERTDKSGNGAEAALLASLQAGNDAAGARMAVYRACGPRGAALLDILVDGRPSLTKLASEAAMAKWKVKPSVVLVLTALSDYRERCRTDAEAWNKRGPNYGA